MSLDHELERARAIVRRAGLEGREQLRSALRLRKLARLVRETAKISPVASSRDIEGPEVLLLGELLGHTVQWARMERHPDQVVFRAQVEGIHWARSAANCWDAEHYPAHTAHMLLRLFLLRLRRAPRRRKA